MADSSADLAGYGILDRRALRARADYAPAFLVDGLIGEASVNIIVGDSGLGKTPLCVQLGMAVATGLPFCGRPARRGKVLYVDCENSLAAFDGIVTAMERYYGQPELSASFQAWSPQWDARPDAPDYILTICQAVERFKFDLVVIDPLRVIFPRAEIKSEDAVAMVRLQRQLSRDHGTAWLNVHHCRKPNQDPAYKTSLFTHPHEWLLEAAGSRALINQTDTRIGVAPGDDLLLSGFTRVLGPISPFRLIRRYDAGEPLAYDAIVGPDALTSEQRAMMDRLPALFSWAEARSILGMVDRKDDGKLGRLLRAASQAGIIASRGKKLGYERVVPGEATISMAASPLDLTV